jgi:hypothetical protein
MNATVESEQELKEEAIGILSQHLPPHKVARLLALWRVGKGDYVQERDSSFAGETVNSLSDLASKGQSQ